MTTNLIYKPTLLQKLLGRNYKWWYIFTFRLKVLSAYLFSDIFWFVGVAFSSVAVIIVWTINGASDELLTYLVIGGIFYALTTVSYKYNISGNIKSGKISTYLLVPVGYFPELIFTMLADLFKDSLATASVMFFVTLFYLDKLIFSWNILWLIPLWVFAVFLKFALDIVVGFMAFFVTENYGIINAYASFLPFLAGTMIPLVLLGNYFSWLQYLPFAFTFYHPMQIYLGKYTTYEIIYVFFGGIAWCIVLYLLAKLIFKLGLKRNESVGL